MSTGSTINILGNTPGVTGQSIKYDSVGNLYALSGGAKAGENDQGKTILTKYSPIGDILWQKKLQNGYSSHGLAVDSNGDPVITVQVQTESRYYGMELPHLVRYTLAQPWDITTARYDTVSTISDLSYAWDPGFSPDGRHMWWVSELDEDTYYSAIQMFELEIPWDIRTKKLTHTLEISKVSVSSFFGNATITPDGLTLIASEGVPDGYKLAQYALSSPWDISSATLSKKIQFTDPSQNFYNFAFDETGNNLYAVYEVIDTDTGNSMGEIRQHTLSTAWDVESINLTPVAIITTPSFAGYVSCITLDPTGRKLFVQYGDLKILDQYNLDVAWDLSTANRADVMMSDATVEWPTDVAFSPDGKFLFVCGTYLEEIRDRNYKTSPAGTLWSPGIGSLANVSTREFLTFDHITSNFSTDQFINIPFVMHDYINGEYYTISISEYGFGSDILLAYERTKIDPITGEAIGETVNFVQNIETMDTDTINGSVQIQKTVYDGIYNPALEPDGVDTLAYPTINTDIGIAKFSKTSGDIIWQTQIGSLYGDAGYTIQTVKTGSRDDFIIAGTTEVPASIYSNLYKERFLSIKVNGTTGEIIWKNYIDYNDLFRIVDSTVGPDNNVTLIGRIVSKGPQGWVDTTYAPNVVALTGNNDGVPNTVTAYGIPVQAGSTITFSWAYFDSSAQSEFGYILDGEYLPLLPPNNTLKQYRDTTTVEVISDSYFAFYTSNVEWDGRPATIQISKFSCATPQGTTYNFTDSFAVSNWTLTGENMSTDGQMIDGNVVDLAVVAKLDSVSGDILYSKRMAPIVLTDEYYFCVGGCASIDNFGNLFTAVTSSPRVVRSDSKDYLDNLAVVVSKFNQLGEIQWSKVIKGAEFKNAVTGIKATADGGAIVTYDAGYQVTAAEQQEQVILRWSTVVVKFGSLGEVIWSKELQQPNRKSEYTDYNYQYIANVGQQVDVFNEKFAICNTSWRPQETINDSFTERDAVIAQLPIDGTSMEFDTFKFVDREISIANIKLFVDNIEISTENVDLDVTNSALIPTLEDVVNKVHKSSTYQYSFKNDGTLVLPAQGDLQLTRPNLGFFTTYTLGEKTYYGGTFQPTSTTNGMAIDPYGNSYIATVSDSYTNIQKISKTGEVLWSVKSDAYTINDCVGVVYNKKTDTVVVANMDEFDSTMRWIDAVGILEIDSTTGAIKTAFNIGTEEDGVVPVSIDINDEGDVAVVGIMLDKVVNYDLVPLEGSGVQPSGEPVMIVDSSAAPIGTYARIFNVNDPNQTIYYVYDIDHWRYLRPAGGSGSGFVCNIWVLNGQYNIDQFSYDVAYANGDKLTIPGTLLGGTSPENDAIITIAENWGSVYIQDITGTPAKIHKLTLDSYAQPVYAMTDPGWKLAFQAYDEGFVWTNNWAKTYGVFAENRALYDALVNAKWSGSDLIVAYAGTNEDGWVASTFGGEGLPIGNTSGPTGIAKIANDGNSIAWATRLPNTDNHQVISIAVDSSGNTYALNTSNQAWYEGDFAFLTKLSPAGEIEWQNKIGDIATRGSIVVDSSDNVLVMFTHQQYTPNDPVASIPVIKFAPTGSVIWTRHIGGSPLAIYTAVPWGVRYIRTDDTHFYVCGDITSTNEMESSSWLAKLPLDGSGTGDYGRWKFSDTSIPVSRMQLKALPESFEIFIHDADRLKVLAHEELYTSWSYLTQTDKVDVIPPTGGNIIFGDGTVQSTSATNIRQIKLPAGSVYMINQDSCGSHLYAKQSQIIIPVDSTNNLPIGSTVIIITASDANNNGSTEVRTEGYMQPAIVNASGTVQVISMSPNSKMRLIKTGPNLWYADYNTVSIQDGQVSSSSVWSSEYVNMWAAGLERNNNFIRTQWVTPQWIDCYTYNQYLDASLSNNIRMVLHTNISMQPIQNAYDGMQLTIIIRQDAAGGHTVTFPSNFFWPEGDAPAVTPTPYAVDLFSVTYHDQVGGWLCVAQQNFKQLVPAA